MKFLASPGISSELSTGPVGVKMLDALISGGFIMMRENNVIMVNLFVSVAYYYQELELIQTMDSIRGK